MSGVKNGNENGHQNWNGNGKEQNETVVAGMPASNDRAHPKKSLKNLIVADVETPMTVSSDEMLDLNDSDFENVRA